MGDQQRKIYELELKLKSLQSKLSKTESADSQALAIKDIDFDMERKALKHEARDQFDFLESEKDQRIRDLEASLERTRSQLSGKKLNVAHEVDAREAQHREKMNSFLRKKQSEW